MRFMVFVPGNEDSEAGALPSAELISQMTAYNEELARAGVMLAGEGLRPTKDAKKIRFDADGPKVIDGPFTESKELVAGYWMLECKSLDEAVEWVKRAPFGGSVEVQVRPIFEADDFGENLTPELRERETRLRESIAARP